MEIYPYTGTQTGAQDKLAKNWGTEPVLLDFPWIQSRSLPTTVGDYESILKLLPAEQLYVRILGDSPDQGEPENIGLNSEKSLSSRLETERIHVLGVGLNLVSTEMQEFLDYFLDYLSPVLHKNGINSRPEAAVAVFISCPHCTVPFHADPEHNFLFQVKGCKKFHIYPNDDYEIFPANLRERLVATKKCVIPYKSHYQDYRETMNLRPGSATYQAPMAPHWVESNEDINISLAVSVYTKEERTTKRVLLCNRKLRKLNMKPAYPGNLKWSDDLKNIACKSLGKGNEPHFKY